VTLGVLASGGQPGTAGASYRMLHNIPTIDFATAHDYGHEMSALPGSSDGRTLPDPSMCSNTIACDMAQALQMGKPFLIDEAGIQAGTGYPYTFDQRAMLFDAKLAAQWSAGASAYVIWSWSTTSGSWSFSPGDPLNAVLMRYAR